MDKHPIILVTAKALEDCTYLDERYFDIAVVDSSAALRQAEFSDRSGIIVVDDGGGSEVDAIGEQARAAREIAREQARPIILMHHKITLEQKLSALEGGFSDLISLDETREEITTRFLREIYHDIADRQLKKQLSNASDATMAAMRESSNLGGNVHFLVQAHQCVNLDELGQLFFKSMQNYGLNCSLQMRSAFEIKNMEGNGMARQLESELLTQLKDAGRYFDFGRRSVVNYGTVSVLIRNMPEDETLYGLVKDNTFTLLQGLDARVRSLDDHVQLEHEKDALKRLSTRLNIAMQAVNDEYQLVMRGIVEVVENMAERIGEGIPSMMLNEEQEGFIEEVVKDCVLQSNIVFTEGFKVDSHFNALQGEIEQVVEQVETSAQEHQQRLPPADDKNDAVHDIELF